MDSSRAIIQNQLSCRVLIHRRYNTTIIVDPLLSMASAFDVKCNCSRSSFGTQSLNNLSVQFPSTSFTLFVIGSALDFGAFLLGASAQLVYGGVRFLDQGIRLLDPFLLASGEQKFIYIPGNILKKRNPANKPLTSVCTLLCLASVSETVWRLSFTMLSTLGEILTIFEHIWSQFCIQPNNRAW